jgi:DNA-nicking Smr family endonuclease
MTDHDDKDDSDSQLFRKQVGDVHPVSHDKIDFVKKKPKPYPIKGQEDEHQVIIDMMSDEFDSADIESGEELNYSKPGMPPKTLRKLRRGQFAIHAELDLHGMTVPAAREALAVFLHNCHQENLRCIRIIHGKGLGSSPKGPVIKTMVNKWLRQREDILAFCSAIPAHGGTGAAYVLLKKGTSF